MAVRTASSAAAVFTAAVVVYALVQARRVRVLRRQLVRERASHRLVAGCLAHDLDLFQYRLRQAAAVEAVAVAAGRVLDESLARYESTSPPMEGGPR